ncbi:HAD-IA family hydrolase [Modestobacter sp. I12A-02628]|uniref:HAD-IA family hydrolase n=2 Tax=Goekera deserti TaxID=2497753 RepID=A0A7K3WHS4_9ACTN|nr:HAD-IA family hydrolase [Goekera deserti]NDI48413.1 HAD-IA family hydrolase [Goekera deserti]NEL56014.1 HAD-IA family hydrolase [Goekera deserti]
MDGTLIDSMPGALRAWADWAAEHHVDPARMTGLGGLPAVRIISELLPADQVDAGVRRIAELETAMAAAGIELLPGTAETLATLPGDRVAIVTSCTRELLASRLAGSGLAAPAEIVTVDDVARGKPHPDPFLLAAERLGADPRRCLVVEDAPAGLAAGRAAGCATLAVGATHPRHELDADGHAPDLSHVVFHVRPDGISIGPR